MNVNSRAASTALLSDTSPLKKSVQIVSLDDEEDEVYEIYQSPGSDFGEHMRRQENEYQQNSEEIEITD